MDGLDLSGLTDDQLVALVQACCLEAIQRNPAVAAAARDVMLSEAEKIRIAKQATQAELAAARARERERIAREAAAQVKAAEDAAQAQRRAAAAQENARKLAETVELTRHRDMALLRQAGELVGRHPSKLSLLYVQTRHGKQVYINPDEYRYSTQHLCALNLQTSAVRSTVALVKRKPELAAFCVRLTAEIPLDTHIIGREYDWPKEDEQ